MAGLPALLSPDAPRTMRVKAIQVVAPLAFICAGFIVYWSGWPTDGYVLLIVTIGFVFFLIHALRANIPAREWRAGIWLGAYVIFLTLSSYLGGFGGIKILPYPWDLLAVIIGSVLAYYWAVASGIPAEISDRLNKGESREGGESVETANS
jgi:hypothetical protein